MKCASLFLFILINLVFVRVNAKPSVTEPSPSNWTQHGFMFELLVTKMASLQEEIVKERAQNQDTMRSLIGIFYNLITPNASKIYNDCKEAPAAERIVKLQPEKPFREPMTVLCDQEYDSGGWVVIQHRFDGSTNFYRDWKEYKNGFGNLEGEFWLGLDRIHQLTTSKPHELVVLLEDFDGNKTYARYTHFEIGGEAQLYELTQISGYSGTAGDDMVAVKGMKFSTLDSDNDTWGSSCAVTYAGAWWYGACHRSNLNGKYLRGETKEYATGMVWYSFRGHHYALKSAKMMIRPVG
ncbi:ficolin-2-like [Anopheles aquasalis]|uniref:ficolin-2-like n=1 Tax=Anopheles aquasalis TaxID=42839 RepID=UPI00215AE2D4|nr:ficolin-2-like [Anopheles aquasalis]